jgi:hypothetical protein
VARHAAGLREGQSRPACQAVSLARAAFPTDRSDARRRIRLVQSEEEEERGQRKLFGISAETQKARAEGDVLLPQREKSIGELSADEVRTKFRGLGLDVRMDDKATRAQDTQARKLGKLRNSKGRMSRADAIKQVAPHHRLKVDKLTNWVDGKTGARQRHRTAQKKRTPA